MSFFYLSPVKGDISIYLLETIVSKRLEYLSLMYKSQRLTYSEYMIDGSLYDIIGHFTLCIIVILLNNVDFTAFFIKAEEFLFNCRLKTLAAYDLRCFSKRLLRQIRKIESNFPLVDPLTILCQHLLLKPTVHHVSSLACENDCSKHCLKVYFKHCLPFITKREVELRQGVALIPCGKWKYYFTLLFKKNLSNRILNTNVDVLKHDPRILDLLHKLGKNMILQQNNHSVNTLMSHNVDMASKLFPPCMLNLHQHLRQKHRLSHDQRFCYSLFLKDAGMPINQAIAFWKLEYEKPSNGNNCCHNWERDEKRFIYGIRHLYGLEGGKKQYKCHNCQHIQASATSCSEGGCPFKSFDDNALLKVLEMNETDNLFKEIKRNQNQKQYTSACMLYLQEKLCIELNKDYDNFAINFNPVKYFILASKNRIL